MIRLEITGETSKEFLENLFAASAALGGTAQTQPVEEPGKPARTSRKTTPASSDTSAAGNAAETSTSADQSSSTSSTSTTATGDASLSSGTVSREDVQKKCVQYGQPSKGGPAALSALLSEIGADGKWSKVTEDMLPALNARLDDLLA